VNFSTAATKFACPAEGLPVIASSLPVGRSNKAQVATLVTGEVAVTAPVICTPSLGITSLVWLAAVVQPLSTQIPASATSQRI
jgi:hypothetical protein